MKKVLFFTFLGLIAFKSFSQNPTTLIPNTYDTRVITTGVPFLMIASDARAGGMGEQGVATSPDAYSQQWNPSKYTFIEKQMGVGVSYTPYLSQLVNDIALMNLTFYNRFSENSAWAFGLKYFSLGDIEFTEQVGNDIVSQGIERPNELAIDASYILRLTERYSMGVTGRFLSSNLKIPSEGVDAKAASSFAVDVSGYYQTEEIAYDNFDGRWRAGFAVTNIGPPISYDESLGDEYDSFLPTNLRLGAGFDFIFDAYSKLSVAGEVNKLLVPTPPIRGVEREYVDNNDNGVYDENTDDLGDVVNDDVIISGMDDNVSFVSGMFQSFYDAPGGFSEELRELTWALGAEYWYMDSFAVRAGYFSEAEDKGSRKFFTLGAGFTYNVIKVDLSYLFSASKVRNPLENTLRFSLTLNFGEEYDEY
ncbi:type IX secretion system outer membrane channel protein PorV [Neptunitalea lumnitzerae]|uniref:Type IX secretion system protein PorV domain-containing protein n=1 Tax=Neptunitalea lumnitzerae TaxID=2965509 RepID=A0ABQ5MHB2_9FLAO|nr:type IX secretion system outer membrane channel protein PorV [Neptunitalea sp. Y10]GLB48783.1 hypothetical protein Y10_11510 [Neptunitalea sp. Y10]